LGIIALRNESDQQIERLLVAPFFRLPGSGLIQPGSWATNASKFDA
jgi:hypothetical protein